MRFGDLSRIGSQPHLQVVICSVVPIIVYGLAGNQQCGHSFKSGFSQFSNPMEVSIFLAAIFLSNRAGGVKFQDTLIPIDFRKANGICTIPQSPWLYGWYVYHPSQSLAVLFPSTEWSQFTGFFPRTWLSYVGARLCYFRCRKPLESVNFLNTDVSHLMSFQQCSTPITLCETNITMENHPFISYI